MVIARAGSSAAAGRDGKQGEGFIEGVYNQYKLPGLHATDFAYSKFECRGGAAQVAAGAS